MANCTKARELIISTDDKIGMLAEVTAGIATAGANITALCAYGMERKATFMMITSDNQKAKSAAEAKGWQTAENEVVVVELVDKVGAVHQIAEKIKAKNVNIKYCYGTTCTCSADCTCRIVVASNDNDAVLVALK